MFLNAVKPRPLVVLVPLLIGQLALFSVQTHDKEGSTLLKRSTLQVLSPFLLVSHGAGHFVGSFWNEYINLREVRNENEQLRKQVADLTLQAQQNDALLVQARRLQSLLDLKGRQGMKTRTANVIARSPSFLSFSIIIDRGFADGVRKDNAVITVDGVVGRVIDTHAHSSEVQVLVDSDAGAGATIARTRIQGFLNGRGGLVLRLNHLLNQEDVQVGDLVVTSGQDKVYPKDLPLGKVFRVSQGETVFKEIDVLPLVNFNQLEEVIILLETAPTL